jgi:hypothetical protein
MFSSERWEDRFGAINGSILILEALPNNETLSAYFWTYILDEMFAVLLVDTEFRVRNQLGVLLKAILMTDRDGKAVKVFDTLKIHILKNIDETFVRDKATDASSLIRPEKNSGKTMHDTEGWKTLETSMRNLQNIIEAIGTNLYRFELAPVLVVINKAVLHLNRFVREIAFFLINAIFEASEGVMQTEHAKTFESYLESLIKTVASGLGDNWS